MPTAARYRSIAGVLVDARDEIGSMIRPIADDAARVGAQGPPLSAIQAAVDISAINARTLVNRLQTQIDEAYRRARICDAYTEAVRRYRNSTDPAASEPVKPYPWVTYG